MSHFSRPCVGYPRHLPFFERNAARTSPSVCILPPASRYCQNTHPFVCIFRPVMVERAVSAAVEHDLYRVCSNSTEPSGNKVASITLPLYFRKRFNGGESIAAAMRSGNRTSYITFPSFCRLRTFVCRAGGLTLACR